jgi:acyl-CoA synthetase (AMP-forming)/AMP-acid ligase II
VSSAQARQASQLVLGELLRRNAMRTPTAPAIEFCGRRVSFGELDARADLVAGALVARGVRAGDRVALWLFNGLPMVESLFGVHKLGAVAVPVNFRLSADEVDFVLEDASVCGLIADLRLRAAAPVPFDGWELTVDGDGASSYETAVDAATPPSRDGPVEDGSPAFLMYTSGTTGRPKGAVLTHKNLLVNTSNWQFDVGVHRDDVYLFGFPLFHIGGLVGLYPFLHMGGLSVMLPSGSFDPVGTLELIARVQATVCAFVPAQWQSLVEQPDAGAKLGHVRRALWGGSPASRPLLMRMSEVLPSSSVMSTFGQTEVTANATFLQPEDAIRKLGSVGRPALTVEYRIVDDTGEDVVPGSVGEIVYRGPTVMSEYLGRPEATAEAFRGGWFHSGDLVREDDDGYLYVVDRKNDMIISGGENIYPAEVERVLSEHPAVIEAAVFGVPDERWGEVPVACVVVGQAGPEPSELIDFCSARLARYKRPTRVCVVAELPRNPSGKVLKRVLRETFPNAG